VKVAVAADSSRVLEIVAANVAANESCACEIVKAAIIASDANKTQVAKIVNTAILEAPSQIRIIAQCAIAAAPEAVSNVQAVLEQYDAAGGEGYSVKGGLDSPKGADAPVEKRPRSNANPLDFPFESNSSPVGRFVDGINQPNFVFPPIEVDPGATDLNSTVGP